MSEAGTASDGRAEPQGLVDGVCTSVFRVRYAETDQMGVVYHANYLVWCEIGRTDFIRQLGSSYAELERQGLRLAVVEASLRYGASARYDQLIRVRTRLDQVQSRTLTFGYTVEGEGTPPTRLATATTRLLALGADGRPRLMPAELQARLRGALSE